MPVLIRKAVPADAPAIVAHNCAMALETENITLNPEIVSRGVRRVFDDPSKGFYLVAEENGAVVGNLMITLEWSDWRCNDYWWIQSVYLRPETRGRGIFSLLYNEVMRLAGEANAPSVRLYVEQTNQNAQAIYEKLGMKRSHYQMFEVDFV